MLCLGGNYDSIPGYQIALIPFFVFTSFDKQIEESMAHLVYLKRGAHGKNRNFQMNVNIAQKIVCYDVSKLRVLLIVLGFVTVHLFKFCNFFLTLE